MRSETIIVALLAIGFGPASAGWAAGGVTTADERAADDPLRDTMLSAHNAARGQVGVPPLDWDPALAEAARDYAREMASSDIYRHSQPAQRQAQGENLWRGVRGVYGYDRMAATWVEEGRLFVNQPTPMFSTTGHWQDVGHYSQIIWRSTTAVGCGMASSAAYDYVVCRYGPPGNVLGRTAF